MRCVSRGAFGLVERAAGRILRVVPGDSCLHQRQSDVGPFDLGSDRPAPRIAHADRDRDQLAGIPARR